MMLRRRDIVYTTVTLVCLGALNIQPINERIGLYLAVIAALISAFNGVAFFAFVAASQVVSDPLTVPVTLMQAGTVAWVITLPVNGWLRGSRAAGRYWIATGPLVVFISAILAINGTLSLFAYDLVSAVLVGGIAAGYAVKDGQGRLRYLLGGAIAGMFLACMGFWGTKMGLPVTAVEIEDATREFTRVGIGKGDVNTTGLNLPLALWGAIALAIGSGTERVHRRHAVTFILVPLVAFALLLPAILATGSRMAIYQVFGGAAFVLCVAASARKSSGLRRAVASVAVVACVSGAMALMSPIGDELQGYLAAIAKANTVQAASYRSNVAIAGRANAWGTHLRIIVEYPLSGIPAGTTWDFGEYGTAVVGRYGTVGLAHNTVLQVASLAGLPAMLLFIYVMCAPVWRTRSHIGDEMSYPILIVYGLAVLGMLGLSIGGWKTFWILLALVRCLRMELAEQRQR